MADLPINTRSTQELTQVKNSQAVDTKISTDSQTISRNITTVPSQVLSKTDNEIILSIPNQPSIKLDISKDDTLNASLKIGDKVNLSFVKDASTVVITITPQATKPVIELEVPLSKSLQTALTKETSLPNQESVIKSHIEKNTLLPLGQARRLPQEQITLKVNDSTTVKSSLPGINALPLNQTFQTNLVLNNQQQLTVQFTKLPVELPQSQIVIPLQKLATVVSANSLASLPMNQVSNISEIIMQPNVSITDSSQTNDIDMTKPINQLWLRHHNSPMLTSQLSSNVNQVLSLSNEQIRAEINIQQKHTSTQNASTTNIPTQNISIEQSNSIKAPPLNPTVLNSLPDTLKPEILKQELPNSEKTPLTVKAYILPELSLPKATESSNSSNINLTIQPKSNPTNSALQNTNNNTNKSIDLVINESQRAPQISSNSAIEASTPILNKELTTASNKNIPDNPAINFNVKLNPTELPKPAVELTKDSLVSQKSLQLPPNSTLTNQIAPLMTNKETNIGEVADNNTQNITQPSPTKLEQQSLNAPLTRNTTASVPLQKLNDLISTLQSQAPQPPKSEIEKPIEINLSPSNNLQAVATSPAGGENLVAINRLKALSKQITTQLPSMMQLTNPTQLSHLIEQFTRFEPLNIQNLATQSKVLGPLANALQLLLGGRGAAQGKDLSPQLLKHLTSLIKNSNTTTNNNLTTALQMLGNLQSLKPLEESLTNLSSHIQFYQYQNAEQQQNNQSLFYFSMPTKEPNVPQIEGEVEEKNAQDGQSEKSWRLTLLLPCGDSEKIKVNALLTGSKLELDLTCNNKSLVQRADFYLSFLTNRLESLGFDKPSVSCQEGTIPTTLLKRPNQLVELII